MTLLKSVPASDAIDMIGPYLATSAQCPACGAHNRFVFLEGYASPVKPMQRCAHLRARVIDEDGGNHFEFHAGATPAPIQSAPPAGAALNEMPHA